MKPYIEQFTKAVYGTNAELALASFNQQKFLEDATSKIVTLEAENAKLRVALRYIAESMRWGEDTAIKRTITDLQNTALEALEEIK